MNYEAVYRTAPATPGLLTIQDHKGQVHAGRIFQTLGLLDNDPKQQGLFLSSVAFLKVPSNIISCPKCLVSYYKLTMRHPAVVGGLALV